MAILISVTQVGTAVEVEYDNGVSTQNFTNTEAAAEYAAAMQAQIGQNLPQGISNGAPIFSRSSESLA